MSKKSQTIKGRHAKVHSDKDVKSRRRRRGYGSVVLVVVLPIFALAVAYGTGVNYFKDHFIPGTTVGGRDVSQLTTAELSSELDSEIAEWTCEVQSEGDFSLLVTATDAGLTINSTSVAETAMAQNDASLWPIELFVPLTLGANEIISYDADKLEAFVGDAVDTYNKGATKSTDAYIDFDEDSGSYVVVADVVGNKLDRDVVIADVDQAVSSMAQSCQIGVDAIVQPKLSADDETLTSAVAAANAALALEIPLSYQGEVVATISHDELICWVSLDDDYAIKVDTDAIYTWLTTNISDQVYRETDTTIYGLDVEATSEAIEAAIKEEKSDTIELVEEVTQSLPAITQGASELGRHIDVNLTTQYARFYNDEGDIIWESYIVSGNVSEGRDTPTGDFSILSKQTERTLIGADEDGDGKPDYESFVHYWMLFKSGGYGLHDASWRTYFGGEIYQYDGSHGCINLPSAKAAELFELCRVGDRVIVHT